jgi:hypothetical protein
MKATCLDPGPQIKAQRGTARHAKQGCECRQGGGEGQEDRGGCDEINYSAAAALTKENIEDYPEQGEQQD